MDRPNILVITSDQHRFDCLGINSKFDCTPNLDKLAKEGINFTNAYTPCPVCTPARVSMITGQYPSTHKVLSIPECSENPKKMDISSPNYFRQLKKVGYTVCYVGKWHLNSIPGTDTNPHPYDLGIDKYVSDMEYFDFCEVNGIKSKKLDSKSGKSDYSYWKNEVDDNVLTKDSKLNFTADKIIDIFQQKDDKPLFVRWDPSEPHLPCYVPKEFAEKFRNISVWESCIDDLSSKPYALRNLKRSWGIENISDTEISSAIGLYLAEINLMDYNIGRVIDELKRLGLYNNTAIIYTSDHGDMCGSHRLFDKHFNMYDDIVRVPLIIKYPAIFKPESVSNDFVSSAIDAASTVCEIAGVEIPDTFEGISLCENGKTNRQDITSAYYGGPSGLYSMRMLRNNEYKYVFNASDIDELYDLNNDPWEINNLIYDEEYNSILGDMRKRLVHLLSVIDDPVMESPWIKNTLLGNKKL